MRGNVAMTCLIWASLFLPATAQTGVEVEFSNGNVYLKEDRTLVLDRDVGQSSEEMALEILRLTNQARRENGLPELQSHSALANAAGEHSREMRTLNYFSHVSPTPGRETLRKRVQGSGLNPKMLAENIFECSGYDLRLTARFAVESFLNSPDHRANIMDKTITHIGIGVCEIQGSVSVTQVFGAGI